MRHSLQQMINLKKLSISMFLICVLNAELSFYGLLPCLGGGGRFPYPVSGAAQTTTVLNTVYKIYLHIPLLFGSINHHHKWPKCHAGGGAE